MDEIGNIYTIPIPSLDVNEITRIFISSSEVIDSIPKVGGNYWIITNEPIKHCMHSGVKVPSSFEMKGEQYKVVYNGVSINLNSRARDHLLRLDKKGDFGSMSGISVDILMLETVGKTKSHAKCLFSKDNKKKTPKIKVNGTFEKISIDNILEVQEELHLTKEEIEYISNKEEVYFKNGIDIEDMKHCMFDWYFCYIPIDSHNIREYIEKEWRKEHGVPLLCSYNEGR